MLRSIIVRIVDVCCRFAWATCLVAVIVTGLSVEYARQNFAINTDTTQLISAALPWRQRELDLDLAFPHRSDVITVVLDGATPELAEQAADRLMAELQKAPELFKTVKRPDGGPFFARNGLLFLPKDEVSQTMETLIRSQAFLGPLAADPTLRGLVETLGYIPAGAQAGQTRLDDFVRPITLLGDAFEDVLAGRPSRMAWSELMTGKAPTTRELRKFVDVQPVLDYAALEPGERASRGIREAANKLAIDERHGVKVRLTGLIPIQDEEFGTLTEGMELNTSVTVLLVLLIIWMALKSGKLIVSVFLALVVGLAATAAAGLAMVGSLNPISVAFAVLFVGIGVDFGIQYSVRYRAERHIHPDLGTAVRSAVSEAAVPLALAAAATAAGFLVFLPTDYRGVSELGLIAGVGMLIAFVTSITLLPALITILKPPGEGAEVGYAWLAPVDRVLARWRYPILAVTGLAVAAGLPLLMDVKFDFNPMNLRSNKVESVSTYLDLLKDPINGLNNLDVLTADHAAARQVAERAAKVPEVDSVMTLDSFVPDDQDEKLKLIADAAALIGPTLNPAEQKPAPTDAETVEALNTTADAYSAAGHQADTASVQAMRLSALMRKLAMGTPEQRTRAEAALLPGLKLSLDKIRNSLSAAPVSRANLPQEIVRDWIARDGRERVQIAPKGDANDNAVLRKFASAVLAVEPEATGGPVLIQESANTVVKAFTQAGTLAFFSIMTILLVVLRRFSDMVYTLVPLVLAGIVTLELCALLDLQLNFANIIALPLLLGVGVAFKIYYVLAWRAGEGSLLASSLTRAVFFSALTTAVAFGSLWMSEHPGTSSMGKLLSLSLVTTLTAAVIFQPILMGPPRNPKQRGEGPATTGAAAVTAAT